MPYQITTAIEVPKSMLIFSGVWPFENKPILYQLKFYISYGMSLLFQALMTLEVALSLENFFYLSDVFCVYFEYFAYTVKLLVVHWERQTVYKLSMKLKEPLFNSNEEHHRVFVENAVRRTNFIGNAFKLACVLTITAFALRPYIEGKIFPVSFSFFHEGIMWYLMYIFQVNALAIGIWNHSAVDTLCIGYMGIALAELVILINKIQYYANIDVRGDQKAQSAVEDQLNYCSKHHNLIIEFIKDIEQVFTKGILAQYVCSIFVICNTGFHLLMTPILSTQFLTLILYFGTVMIELAMYCWFGNEIILKSLEISNACYMSKWYQFDTRVNRIIFMLMERSKRPLTISAYKFSVLSLSAYIKVIQRSYSFFTVLRRVYMKD